MGQNTSSEERTAYGLGSTFGTRFCVYVFFFFDTFMGGTDAEMGV